MSSVSLEYHMPAIFHFQKHLLASILEIELFELFVLFYKGEHNTFWRPVFPRGVELLLLYKVLAPRRRKHFFSFDVSIVIANFLCKVGDK